MFIYISQSVRRESTHVFSTRFSHVELNMPLNFAAEMFWLNYVFYRWRSDYLYKISPDLIKWFIAILKNTTVLFTFLARMLYAQQFVL